MDAVYNFLFNTRPGLAVLFIGGVILFVLIAYVMERRTQKIYVDRGPADDDDEDGGLFS